MRKTLNPRPRRLALLGLLAALVAVSALPGCTVVEPERVRVIDRPSYWVPGHWVPGGYWAGGHWR